MKRVCVCITAGLLLMACSGDGGTGSTPTGTITGQVIDADSGSAGVPGVSVQLAGGSGSQTVVTGTGGAFTLGNAAAGAWTATLQLPASYRLAANESGTRTATVTADQTATLTQFRMARPKGSVTGTATADGAGVAGGSVAAARGGFTGLSATPAAAGYTIAGLAVGPWTLTYTPPSTHVLASGESGTRMVTIAEGQTTAATAFQLQPAAPSQVREIRLSAETFVGGTITIPPGTTVRWINEENVFHTVTPENATQSGVWQRQTTSAPGTVLEHTFTVPSQTYRYRCEPHSSSFTAGMVGTITVTS